MLFFYSFFLSLSSFSPFTCYFLSLFLHSLSMQAQQWMILLLYSFLSLPFFIFFSHDKQWMILCYFYTFLSLSPFSLHSSSPIFRYFLFYFSPFLDFFSIQAQQRMFFLCFYTFLSLPFFILSFTLSNDRFSVIFILFFLFLHSLSIQA